MGEPLNIGTMEVLMRSYPRRAAEKLMVECDRLQRALDAALAERDAAREKCAEMFETGHEQAEHIQALEAASFREDAKLAEAEARAGRAEAFVREVAESKGTDINRLDIVFRRKARALLAPEAQRPEEA